MMDQFGNDSLNFKVNLRSLLVVKKDVHPAVGFHYDSSTKGNEAIAKQLNFKFSALLNERESNLIHSNEKRSDSFPRTACIWKRIAIAVWLLLP